MRVAIVAYLHKKYKYNVKLFACIFHNNINPVASKSQFWKKMSFALFLRCGSFICCMKSRVQPQHCMLVCVVSLCMPGCVYLVFLWLGAQFFAEWRRDGWNETGIGRASEFKGVNKNFNLGQFIKKWSLFSNHMTDPVENWFDMFGKDRKYWTATLFAQGELHQVWPHGLNVKPRNLI